MNRELFGKSNCLLASVTIFYTLFQIYVGATDGLEDLQQPVFHVLVGFIVVFGYWGATKADAKRRKLPFYDLILILITTVACLNIFINHVEVLINPYVYNIFDIILGGCMIILVLETTRRTVGLILPGLAIFMLVYALATGSTLESTIMYLYYFDFGMWGVLVTISSTVIAVFLIFGSFLVHTGGGQTFIDIANSIGGKYRGGPAQIAVISSSLFGMISGSPVANTATTGNFTIPLMKKVGYKPEVAGAIEATASTEGQLVPPVMGASAFVMAAILGISYLSICGHAIIPAVLIYVSFIFYVYFEAIRSNIQPIEQTINVKAVLSWAKLGPLVLPVGFLVTALIKGFTPQFAAFLAVILCLFTYTFRDLKPSAVRLRLREYGNIFSAAGKAVAYIVPLLVCAQIVVALLGSTGLGVKLSSFVVAFGESFRFLALITAALLALMLGMGVPPVGAYVLSASIVAPALLRLGVMPLASHFFSFSFAALAAITPPVCAAVYVGASIAKANWLKTGMHAVRIASVAFLIPFSYTLFEPYLLGIGPTPIIIINFILGVVGSCFIASGVAGASFKRKLNLGFRICFFIAGSLILVPFPWPVRTIGGAMVIGGLLIERIISARKTKRDAQELPVA